MINFSSCELEQNSLYSVLQKKSLNNPILTILSSRGADLAALVREACMVALRERIHVHSTGHESIKNQPPPEQSPLGVGKRHFLAAFQKVKPSVSKKVRRDTLQDFFGKPCHPSWCSHEMSIIVKKDFFQISREVKTILVGSNVVNQV